MCIVTNTVGQHGRMFKFVCLSVCLSGAELKKNYPKMFNYKDRPWDIIDMIWFWSLKVIDQG